MQKDNYKLIFGGADTLQDGQLYAVILKDDTYEIRSITADDRCFRPFKIGGTGLDTHGPIDVVPMDAVRNYLYRVWGIEVDNEACDALGFTLDRTERTIIERKNLIKNDWNVTVEKNEKPEQNQGLYIGDTENRSLRGRTVLRDI